jgi:hypothetical protein
LAISVAAVAKIATKNIPLRVFLRFAAVNGIIINSCLKSITSVKVTL